MEILSNPTQSNPVIKRSAFTLIEMMMMLTLLMLILAPLSIQGHQYLMKWRFKKDIAILKQQIQQAYDVVLHCNLPIYLRFKKEAPYISCRLELENKALAKRLPTFKRYSSIQDVYVQQEAQHDLVVPLSLSGDLPHPVTLQVTGYKNHQASVTLQGTPHVVEFQID